MGEAEEQTGQTNGITGLGILIGTRYNSILHATSTSTYTADSNSSWQHGDDDEH